MLAVVSGLLVHESRAEAVSISVTQNSANVIMNLEFQENITGLPLIHARIGSLNSTSVIDSYSQPFASAIQKSVHGASLNSFDLQIETSNKTGLWTLDENYTIGISGINTNSGSNIASNLAFVSMNVTVPIEVGGVELNFVGPDLILPALEAKVAEFSNLKYYIDGSTPTNQIIPELTTKQFLLLDFNWATPVQTWTSSQNILNQQTNWTFDPPNPPFNLTLAVPSPEGPFVHTWTATYSPSLSVSVPANAWADGNTVYFDVPTPSETIMPGLAIATLIAAIATAVFDRRLTGRVRNQKKRQS